MLTKSYFTVQKEMGGEDVYPKEEQNSFGDPRIDARILLLCMHVDVFQDRETSYQLLCFSYKIFFILFFGCKFVRFVRSIIAISEQLYILHHVLRRQHRDSHHMVQLQDQKSLQNLPQRLSRYFLLRCSQFCRRVNPQPLD